MKEMSLLQWAVKGVPIKGIINHRQTVSLLRLVRLTPDLRNLHGVCCFRKTVKSDLRLSWASRCSSLSASKIWKKNEYERCQQRTHPCVNKSTDSTFPAAEKCSGDLKEGVKTASFDLSLDYGPHPTLIQRLVQSVPKTLRAYLQLVRLDRPIGSWLLFWPCGWSIAMAAAPGSLPDLSTLALFALGAVVMRGAGCTINDMWDKDYDGKVARTASRPLASGALSMFDALVCLGTQLSLGCLVLLQLNWYAVLLGASSLGLVVLYPLMKRVTYWPQLMLGFTFNWGALLGWAAVRGSCDWTVCLPLYTAGIAWTLIYDTIYAHQDKYDDAIIGIKSTALKFGDATRKWLGSFGVMMISSLILTGYNAQLAWPYYLAVTIAAAHVGNQVRTLDINSPKDCGEKFRANRHLGLLLFAGIIGGTFLKIREDSTCTKDSKDHSLSCDISQRTNK